MAKAVCGMCVISEMANGIMWRSVASININNYVISCGEKRNG